MPIPWVTYLWLSCTTAATAERDNRPISQHKVAGSVGTCAAQQQQPPLKPCISLSCRRASGCCIVRSVAVFVAGRALDGPVVRHVVCVRARSTINPDGSSGMYTDDKVTDDSYTKLDSMRWFSYRRRTGGGLRPRGRLPNKMPHFFIFCPRWPWPLTLTFKLGWDFCTIHLSPSFIILRGSSFGNYRIEKQTDK